MSLPPSDTPLYSHPLPEIENWLKQQGCQQDEMELHCWRLETPTWKAQLWLDVEQILVKYIEAGESGEDIHRAFKYSLTRKDVESAVFSGP
jgi:Protein of unknown function (DUF3143)